MDLFPFFAFFICAHYAANQNENSFVDFIDVAVGTTKPTFIYEKFQSFTIENFSFVDIPFAPFTYHREQKSCAGRYAQKIPVEIGKIALGTDTLCDQSERPTNEIKKGSNNVDNQSANVLKKTNNNSKTKNREKVIMEKQKKYSKTHVIAYRLALKKTDVVFYDFDNSARIGCFCGHIKVPPRRVKYQLLVRYEAKIAAHLINAGFAVKEFSWNINTDEAEIYFWAAAKLLKQKR